MRASVPCMAPRVLLCYLVVLAASPAALAWQVSAGEEATCAVVDSGRSVSCWPVPGGSSNLSGTVAASPSSSRFVSVCAGHQFACAAQDDSRIACWGAAGSSSYVPSGIPTPLPSGARVRSVGCGYEDACAVHEDGVAYCWGRGSVRIDTTLRYSTIAVGWYHACGITTSGDVSLPDDSKTLGSATAIACGTQSTSVWYDGGNSYGWGSDGYGQFDPPRSWVDVITASASRGVSCAVYYDGALSCWGDKTYGETSVPAVPAGQTWVGVSVGYYHVCGVLANGTTLCWGGRNKLGLLDTSVIPTYAATAMCSWYGGNEWGCNKVECHYESGGQCASGKTELSSSAAPIIVIGSEAEESMCTAASAKCIVVDVVLPNGTVFNLKGLVRDLAKLLGVNQTSIEAVVIGHSGSNYTLVVDIKGPRDADQITDTLVKLINDPLSNLYKLPNSRGISRITKWVSAGDEATCAVVDSGRGVSCWPVPGGSSNLSGTVAASPSSSRFVSVCAGHQFACAAQDDSRIACWGADGSSSYVPSGIPTPLPSVARVRSVGCGYEDACAVHEDGVAYCWGRGSVRINTTLRYSTVAVGWYHACGITTARSVVCAGQNDMGQLSFAWFEGGNSYGWGSDPSGQFDPPRSWVDVTTASASRGVSCAVYYDGALSCWGDKTYGETNVPAVPAGQTWVGVSVGYYHVCGVLANGTTLCWGGSSNGGPLDTSMVPAYSTSAMCSWYDGNEWGCNLTGCHYARGGGFIKGLEKDIAKLLGVNQTIISAAVIGHSGSNYTIVVNIAGPKDADQITGELTKLVEDPGSILYKLPESRYIVVVKVWRKAAFTVLGVSSASPPASRSCSSASPPLSPLRGSAHPQRPCCPRSPLSSGTPDPRLCCSRPPSSASSSSSSSSSLAGPHLAAAASPPLAGPSRVSLALLAHRPAPPPLPLPPPAASSASASASLGAAWALRSLVLPRLLARAAAEPPCAEDVAALAAACRPLARTLVWWLVRGRRSSAPVSAVVCSALVRASARCASAEVDFVSREFGGGFLLYALRAHPWLLPACSVASASPSAAAGASAASQRAFRESLMAAVGSARGSLLYELPCAVELDSHLRRALLLDVCVFGLAGVLRAACAAGLVAPEDARMTEAKFPRPGTEGALLLPARTAENGALVTACKFGRAEVVQLLSRPPFA
eukprot:m51a1_g7313 hypothetical protein (1180) ;mRNA; f:128296-133312